VRWPSCGRAKMPVMDVPPPPALIERVRSLPAAGPLLARVGDIGGLYLVGGALRDLLLGRAPYGDLDLVVEGDPDALARRLGRARTHDRFGTATVAVDGFTYDIARARAESYAHPGALPDVRPADLEQDLRRRDFTVNALATALGGDGAGEIRAAPGALEDLEAKRLRVLHDRSFVDDPTRLLRLARYAARLGFEVEPATLTLAREAIDEGALETVSGPRIGAEVRLLAREPDPVCEFDALRGLGLDTAIHPRFRLEAPQLARTALALLPDDGRRDLLVLAAAGRGIPGSELRELLDRLGFEARDRDRIAAAATGAERTATALQQAASPSEIAAAVGPAEPELVAIAGALGAAEAAREWLDRLRHVRLEIDGGDLIEAGVPEGPAVGEGLRAALAAKLDGLTSGRDDELRRAMQAANPSG
jgi:tRNA nucleotidyltransferase (CCA-adding enzyme)